MDLDNVKIQRLAALEKTQPGITEFYRWLDSNRDRFQGQVYGPILLEVEVEDASHATYLENTCGRKQPPLPPRPYRPLCIFKLRALAFSIQAVGWGKSIKGKASCA